MIERGLVLRSTGVAEKQNNEKSTSVRFFFNWFLLLSTSSIDLWVELECRHGYAHTLTWMNLFNSAFCFHMCACCVLYVWVLVFTERVMKLHIEHWSIAETTSDFEFTFIFLTIAVSSAVFYSMRARFGLFVFDVHVWFVMFVWMGECWPIIRHF